MKYLLYLIVFGILGCQSKQIHDSAVKNQLDQIGTKSFQWIDSTRIDEDYGGNRLINVQIWYPANHNESGNSYPVSQYYYKIDCVYQKLAQWSKEDYQLVSKIPVDVLVNCPISSKSNYPILIFSPGLGGNFSQYTFYFERLAKSGFVVVGVNHLYESEYVINNELQVFPAKLDFHDSLKTLEIPKQITADEYRKVKGIRQRVLGQDLVFCLDKLIEINQSEFQGKLDLQSIGVWGHSIGGAAAIYAAMLDGRYRAVLNIDGTPPVVALKDGISVPFMFIEDLTDYENHTGYMKQHQRRNSFCQINSADSYRILLGGVNHNSFLDINYHLAQTMGDKQEVLDILQKTESYINQFFTHYLKGTSMDIIATQSDSLEIIKYIKN